MNYLLAVDYWFPDFPGGAARVAWDMVRLMRDRGHSVTVLCVAWGRGTDKPRVTEEDGIRIVRCEKPELSAWNPSRLEQSIEAAAATARERLADVDWDLVHIHSHITGAGVLRALGKPRRVVMTLHSPIVLEQKVNWVHEGLLGQVKLLLGTGSLRRLESGLLTASDDIHTLSQFTRDRVQEAYGLGDKVTVVPYWKRPDFKRTLSKKQARAELGWPESTPIFFTIRQLRERYGLGSAIDAIAPYARDGRCRFYIGGEGPLRETLADQIRQLGLESSVELTGRLSDEALIQAYQAADVFVLPTLALECFGLISIEAMAFGCPVFASDSSAIPETLRPFRPDLLFPAGDTEALRGRIGDYLEGRLELPTPDDVVDYIDSNYSQEVIVPRLMALLERDAG